MNPEHLNEKELLHYAEQRDDPWVAALLRLFGERQNEELEDLRAELEEEIDNLEMELEELRGAQ